MVKQIKSISLIGSTGSIGTQALDIIRSAADIKIKALSAGHNLDLFIKQIEYFQPEYASILAPEHREILKAKFPKLKILNNVEEIAEIPVDVFVSAIVGISGLRANLKALQYSKRLAIANKETLVVAGHLVREMQSKYGSELIPIDSEHAAIHQCLMASGARQQVPDPEARQEVPGTQNPSVKQILLTSSGGPFRTWTKEEISKATLADALKHPTWTMGAKITVDSSTLMNKALEVIELNALFGIDYDRIQIVIHPQSIVHSAVSFIDGNTIAQMGSVDMRVPIQYSIFSPERLETYFQDSFDIFKMPALEFFEPNPEKFPAIKLAYQAGSRGHSYTTVLNSANEMAVELFLKEQIRYTDITNIIESELSKHTVIHNPNLENILSIDQEIRANIQASGKTKI